MAQNPTEALVNLVSDLNMKSPQPAEYVSLKNMYSITYLRIIKIRFKILKEVYSSGLIQIDLDIGNQNI